MAGDWIKMRTNLWDDPRVSSLADATRTGEATVIGGLYWLWSTADQHSVDGRLDGYLLLGHGRPGGPGTPPDPNMVVVVEAHAFGDPADYAAFRASQNDGTFI